MDSEQQFIELEAVPHPGETVMEYLEFQGWSQRDLARRTDLTPKTISEICNGKGTDHSHYRLALGKSVSETGPLLAEPATSVR